MGFVEFIFSCITIVSIGEGLNCMYPYHDGEIDNEGMVCQWEHETFYYDEKEDKWILFPEDSNDNCIEKEIRKRYWKKREKLK